MAVAEYRPNKPSIIYRVDPLSLRARKALRTPDHIGGIVHDTRRDRLLGLNWGSRTAYEWKLGRAVDRHDGQPEPLRRLPGLQVPRPGAHLQEPGDAVQRHRRAAHPGPDGQPVNYDLGGVALVDVTTMRPLNEVPFQEYTDQRQVATRNAIDVQIVDGRLRLYLVADDDQSNLLIYEAVTG